MKAHELAMLAETGQIKPLIGRRIFTMQIGDWPGGAATIIALTPDPAGAPEIVFQVRHVSENDPETGRLFEIGVLDHEDVDLL